MNLQVEAYNRFKICGFKARFVGRSMSLISSRHFRVVPILFNFDFLTIAVPFLACRVVEFLSIVN